MGKVIDEEFETVYQRMAGKVQMLASQAGLACSDSNILEAVLESYPIVTENELRIALAALYDGCSAKFLNDCALACEKEFSKRYSIAEKIDVLLNRKVMPVGLALSRHLEQFPFESLPSIRHIRQEVFRVPSLLVAVAMFKTHKTNNILARGVNEANVFYVVNPANNLEKTQDMFEKRFLAKSSWSGVFNVAPKADELANALANRDIYIFFGHGAGSMYYRQIPDGLDGVNVRAASVVVGCSSGRLRTDGSSLESFGTAYQFLSNGAPCYVGALWDVTDRDIDKFADHLLEQWLSDWRAESSHSDNAKPKTKHQSVAKACAAVRDVCKLKYLIGSATVVYGIPVRAFIN